MKGRLIIRKSKPADAREIVRMASALSEHEQESDPSHLTEEIFLRDGFGNQPLFITLVAELDGVLVGYALFHPGYDVHSAAKGVYLADIYVDPAVRRNRIGFLMMFSVARECLSSGAGWIAWTVREKNQLARQFYRNIGAKPFPGSLFSIDAAAFLRDHGHEAT